MFSPCTKYRRLKQLAGDGRASDRQLRFIDKHESSCRRCTEEHAAVSEAMSALRSTSIEPGFDQSFESRIIRQVRVERKATSVSYWLPAIAGAVVTSAALLAILQILFAAPIKESIDTKGREAQIGIPSYSVESVVTDPSE